MQKFKILIIDDIEKNIFALITVLEKNPKFEIKGISNAIEALSCIDNESFDLILCDVQMPNMDGFEFVSIIRLRKKTADIPVIFVSAHQKNKSFFQKSKDLGAIDYLIKPIDEEELIHRLNVYYSFAMREHQKINELNVLNDKLIVANELTQLIDTANAPIFGINAQGNVNEWNQQAEKITGFKSKEVMDRDLVANFITDDYRASVGEIMEKALKGEETANFEFPLFTKSGDRVDVLLNSTTRRDASGKIVGVIGVGQDITELNQVRVEQERERKEAAAQIIQSSKLATLGEMATSVAHELNQPLNVIRMAAGNSRRKISKGIAEPEYLIGKLERIEEQTARAAAIIDHMRMFGREAKEHFESIDPRNVVTKALDLMGEQLRFDGINVVTELPEDCSFVLGHTIQMEQVILNLLTNARDSMAENDVEAKITLRVFEGNKAVHITTEDTGVGIPEDVLSRIFEPFYTTKEMGKGTGLGLSVSYGIVHDMNGTIAAENIDDGARFTITLPIAS
ncbi:MAG: PAS domain S-box-containing protein [Candidatus Azotimanducaceae bacterium]|jgi:PAS domain S-box-containing protein